MEGEWIGSEGKDTFRLFLVYKEKDHLAANYYHDIVLGSFVYSENGKVIHDCFVPTEKLNFHNATVLITTNISGDNIADFREPGITEERVSVSFKTSPWNKNKAIWKKDHITVREKLGVRIIDHNGLAAYRSPPVSLNTHESRISNRKWHMTRVK